MSNWEKPTRYLKCVCGETIPDWDAYERNGKVYGRCCLLKTAERRAQEYWFERNERP